MDNKYTSAQWQDNAWDHMAASLDQHMPERKRRYPIYWWLIGGVLILAIVSAGILYPRENSTSSPDTDIAAEMTQLPVENKPTTEQTLMDASRADHDHKSDPTLDSRSTIAKNKLTTTTTDNLNLGTSGATHTPKSSKTILLPVSNSTLAQGSDQVVDIDLATDLSDDVTSEAAANTSISDAAAVNDLPPRSTNAALAADHASSQAAVSSSNRASTTLLTLPSTEAVATRDITLAPPALSSGMIHPLSTEFISIPSVPLLRKSMITSVPAASRPGPWMISAQAHAYTTDLMQAYQIGIARSVFESSTWSIDLGFHYQFLQVQLAGSQDIAAFNSSADAENVTIDTGSGQISSEGSTSETLLAIVKEAHQLRLEARASRELSDRISVFGAIGVSRVIGIRAPYELDAGRDGQSTDPGLLEFAYNRRNNFPVDAEFNAVNHWDAQLSAGLTYRLSPRLSADASYRHGFIPLIRDSFDSSKGSLSRSVGIGLRYKI